MNLANGEQQLYPAERKPIDHETTVIELLTETNLLLRSIAQNLEAAIPAGSQAGFGFSGRPGDVLARGRHKQLAEARRKKAEGKGPERRRWILDFARSEAAAGRPVFKTKQIQDGLGITPGAANSTLFRMANAGDIKRVAGGVYFYNGRKGAR